MYLVFLEKLAVVVSTTYEGAVVAVVGQNAFSLFDKPANKCNSTLLFQNSSYFNNPLVTSQFDEKVML